ncbi:MAG: DUF2330 domain-containing protein [Spirochaetota bacterium]
MLCGASGGPLLPTPAAADRGAVTFIPHALLNEPRQQAVLAWNEQEQITVLSTDLRSSEPTRILQVMPFPSEPLVEEAGIQIFEELNRLAIEGLRSHSYGRSPSRSGEPDQPQPPGEITFHERIGAHEIFTIRADRAEGFASWVKDRLREHGVQNPRIPYILRVSVEEYIQEGYRWFVFDIVDVGPELSTVDAVSYRSDLLDIRRLFEPESDAFYILFESLRLRDFYNVTFVPGFRRSSLRDTVMPELDALFSEDSPVYLSV